MEYRSLDITVISAKGLKKASLIGKMDVYADVYIDGGSDPSWDFPMKFDVDEAAGLQNRLRLVVEIKHKGTFGDKEVGEVHVPIKELLDSVSKDGNSEKLEAAAVPAYPTLMADGSSFGYQQPYVAPGGYYPHPAGGYPPQPQPGHAYQQEDPGYVHLPPPPAAYGGYTPQPRYGYPPVQQPQQPPKKNGLGMGLGACLLGGALGGLLIADIASDAAGGCGGGCGGG